MMNAWDRTPRDGAYDTCERTCARLLIYYDEGTHRDITELMQFKPTTSRTKGEEWVTSRGMKKKVKHTIWIYSTEDECQSMDLRDHLDLLLSKITDDRVKAVQALKNVKMGVDCIWWSKYAIGGPTITSWQMKRLGELRLECSFDISFYGDDEGAWSTESTF